MCEWAHARGGVRVGGWVGWGLRSASQMGADACAADAIWAEPSCQTRRSPKTCNTQGVISPALPAPRLRSCNLSGTALGAVCVCMWCRSSSGSAKEGQLLGAVAPKLPGMTFPSGVRIVRVASQPRLTTKWRLASTTERSSDSGIRRSAIHSRTLHRTAPYNLERGRLVDRTVNSLQKCVQAVTVASMVRSGRYG